MLFGKNVVTLLTIIFFIFPLFGCATTYDRGNGIVIAEKKLKDRDYKPHNATKMGALVGGSVGAVGGAAAGGVLGLGLGALGGVAGPMLVATTLGGAVIGGLIVGGVGAITGGGVGYAVDITRPGAGLYQFEVKPEHGSKPLTIIQYSTPIPIHSQVHILEKDNAVFITQ